MALGEGKGLGQGKIGREVGSVYKAVYVIPTSIILRI